IFRSAHDTNHWQALETVAAEYCGWIDTSVEFPETYYYYLRSSNGNTNTVSVASVYAPDPFALSTQFIPELSATLTFQYYPCHQDYFQIERTIDNGSTWQQAAAEGQSPFDDNGLTEGTGFKYRVRAHVNGFA